MRLGHVAQSSGCAVLEYRQFWSCIGQLDQRQYHIPISAWLLGLTPHGFQHFMALSKKRNQKEFGNKESARSKLFICRSVGRHRRLDIFKQAIRIAGAEAGYVGAEWMLNVVLVRAHTGILFS